ncbi:MAG TPA: MmgE/PrpD family protein, partial [Bradyrhizobium sp.]|nr:MmgE/PrpD family protein [Bradyrhizobium sp.]
MPDAIPRRQLVTGLTALAFCGLQPRAGTAQQASPGLPVRPLAERLAAYAEGLRYDDLDAATIERVKSHVIDTLGCGIAAFDEAPVRICRDVAVAHAGGSSSIIGTNQRVTPDLAAFANGAAFRYYDLNDVYVGRLAGHPSDHIAACLAVAESERASAAELITAIVLAYEINCRLIDALDIGARGWDPPVLSLPAVALAAGKLMRLPADRLVQAVNLA